MRTIILGAAAVNAMLNAEDEKADKTLRFTSNRRDLPMVGWVRSVMVAGQEYSVSIKRDKRVRIAFKPRGENWGWTYHGTVYRIGQNSGRVWEGRVPGSLGVRGLLKRAGVL